MGARSRSVRLVWAVLLLVAGCTARNEVSSSVSASVPTAPTAPSQPTPSTLPLDVAPPTTPPFSPGPPAHPLDGRTFTLTEMSTDASGGNTMDPAVLFNLNFGRDWAFAEGSCGVLVYPSITVGNEVRQGTVGADIDLGGIKGAQCVLGGDPRDPPQGPLFWSLYPARLCLGTGFTSWCFAEVTQRI